nr:endopeptidase La [FCB group bacterium]
MDDKDNNELDGAKPREIPLELPLLVISDTVIFPNVIFPLSISDASTIKMINDALDGDRLVGVVTAKPREDGSTPTKDDVYSAGTVVGILKMFRVPDNSVKLLVQGINRFKIEQIIQDEPYKIARIEVIQPDRRRGRKIEALSRLLLDEYKAVIDYAPYLTDDIKMALLNIKDAEILADLIASNLNLEVVEKQKILEIEDLEARLKEISGSVSKELKLLKLRDKIKGDVDEKMEESQRQYYLREQLKAIKKELGEQDEHSQEMDELEKKVLETPMPEQAREAAKKELSRLSKMSPASAEYTVSRTYLDWIVDLPWELSTEDTIDIEKARKVLEDDHYGLKDVKERILEYLAVRKLKHDTKGPILCLSGPPGVGKTSLGRSIAKATGRKFVRFALGGMRDEAEIRGHRRTYIGALPGRIIQALKNAGANNPVFMLDEIDKVGADFRGNPESALLEVLDPEQNNTFTDHYLDLEFDLSKIMFITTANIVHTISPPLLDRMEIIQLPGYITQEKVEIARRYLIPRQLEENGLKKSQLDFTKSALSKIVPQYTRESGVRNLEREIARACRKTAYKVAAGESVKEKITIKNYTQYLGEPKYFGDITDHPPMVGVATGLAYTPVGGAVLLIECTAMPGGKTIHITGRLGEVMKESAEIALSYLRSKSKKYHIKSDFFAKNEIH